MTMDNQEQIREQAEFERDKRKWRIRRRFAITSFICLVLLSVFYVIGPFFMSTEQAEVFSQFNPIIITLIGFFTSIVTLYMGAVTYAENKKDGILLKDVKTS